MPELRSHPLKETDCNTIKLNESNFDLLMMQMKCNQSNSRKRSGGARVCILLKYEIFQYSIVVAYHDK